MSACNVTSWSVAPSRPIGPARYASDVSERGDAALVGPNKSSRVARRWQDFGTLQGADQASQPPPRFPTNRMETRCRARKFVGQLRYTQCGRPLPVSIHRSTAALSSALSAFASASWSRRSVHLESFTSITIGTWEPFRSARSGVWFCAVSWEGSQKES